MTETAAQTGVGLSPAQLVSLFPFHLVLDRSLRVLQFGRSLGPLLPGLTCGAPVEEFLQLKRPEGQWTLDGLRQAADVLHIAEHVPTGLVLRGQIACLQPQTDVFAFLASPWLEGPEGLDRLGLTLSDFAQHDVTLDLIQVVQSMRIANADLRKLADVQRRHRADLQRANADLERLRADRDMILQLSPDGYLAFDHSGAPVYANPVAAGFLGVTEAELAALTLAEVDARIAVLSGVAEGAQPTTALPDGSEDMLTFAAAGLTLRRVVRAVHDSDRQLNGWVIYLRDITKERELDRMRSEFLATAAHELRTPMSSIHGFSEFLMTRELDTVTRREVVETIHDQSHFVVRMVNDLLDLERLSSGTASRELRIGPTDLEPLVRGALEGLMVEADPRRVEFDFTGFGEARVLADPDKLLQALLNLLSNAYRYSRSKGGSISVRLKRRDLDTGSQIGMSVEDHGIGMSPDQVRRVFDRFYRADPASAVIGTGLGMTLVKEIMERMGGTVEIVSAPNVGTTVTLWLVEAKPD